MPPKYNIFSAYYRLLHNIFSAPCNGPALIKNWEIAKLYLYILTMHFHHVIHDAQFFNVVEDSSLALLFCFGKLDFAFLLCISFGVDL
jgi:hypothetical protein